MAPGINANVASLSAQKQLLKSNEASGRVLERISSGLRSKSARFAN